MVESTIVIRNDFLRNTIKTLTDIGLDLANLTCRTVKHVINVALMAAENFLFLWDIRLRIDEWCVWLVRSLMRYKTKIFLAGCALSLIYLISKFMNRKSYKNFDPTKVPTIEHRPDAIRSQLGPNVINYDPRAYPIKNQNQARKTIEAVQLIDYKMQNLSSVACLCKNSIQDCVCPNQGKYAPHAIACLGKDRFKLGQELFSLMDDQEQPIMKIGETYKNYVKSIPLVETLNNWNIYVKVDWKVLYVFETHDTRPSHEKHIVLADTKFAVLGQERLRFVFRILGRRYQLKIPINFLEHFGLPVRDLVVSMDHIKSTRRGRLDSENFDPTLRAILQTSMSVPINDPAFYYLKNDPLRDAYLVTRTLVRGYVPPYVDF